MSPVSRFRRIQQACRQSWQCLLDNTPDPLPLGRQLAHYNGDLLRSDFKAALNVALLAIPQGMAYASIAGLDVVFGIICAAVALLVAPWFASSRFTSLGPTNATALMVFSFFALSPELSGNKVVLVPLLTLMTGLFCVIGSYLKVAELLQYISRSVLVGYITGAGVLIIGNQLKHLLGVREALEQLPDPTNFFVLIYDLALVIGSVSWQTLLIAAATLMLYLLLNRRFPQLPNFAITLLLSGLFSAALIRWVPSAFAQIECLPDFSLHDLSPKIPELDARSWFDNVSTLAGISLALAFLASLENTVMAKNLGTRSGDRPDVNQDMFAVGMANVGSALAGGMPASGSLTRSALNYESGARTGLSSFYCGLLTAVAAVLLAFSSLVSHIPKATLAALVVGISITLFKKGALRICFNSTRSDRAVLLTTIFATLLLRIDLAVFLGVGLSLILFLRKASQPYLIEYQLTDEGELSEMTDEAQRIPAISIVHVEGDLFFGAAELFQTQIQRTVTDPRLRVIILRLKNARHLDATSVSALLQLLRFARDHERHILISGATIDVYRVLKNSGVLKELQKGCDEGQSNLFRYSAENPNLSTKHALQRAQELLGTDEAEIKIFVDENKQKRS